MTVSLLSTTTVVRHFQEYTEPEDSTASKAASSSTRRVHPNPLHPAAPKTDEEKVLLPLGETTLTHNTGIPIIVVITKVGSGVVLALSCHVTAMLFLGSLQTRVIGLYWKVVASEQTLVVMIPP